MRICLYRVPPSPLVLARFGRKHGRSGFLIKLSISCGMLLRILCPLNRTWRLGTSQLVMYVMAVVITWNRYCMFCGFMIGPVQFGCQIQDFIFWFRWSAGLFLGFWRFFSVVGHASVSCCLPLWCGVYGSIIIGWGNTHRMVVAWNGW